MHEPKDPADLVFDHYNQGTGVDEVDKIFRIYRYMMKWGNGTGTDSANQTRAGTRIGGFKVELGYGLGPNSGDFTATTNDDSDGLAISLEECIDDKYFDVDPTFPTGADGVCLAATVEIYQEDEFATFSPSMYSNTDDNRTGPIGGYWDKNPAGIYPPQTSPSATDTNALEVSASDTTPNYFDVGDNQASSASGIPDNMFGNLMYYGIFADNDPGNISMGIYKDDDGDPATEGSLYAWWDGSGFRWGIDADMDGNTGGTIPDPNAWGSLTADELAEIASRPLAEDRVLDPPRYEFGYMDDLAGLNTDVHIKITDQYSIASNGSTFTVRFTAQSIGGADAVWVANPLPNAADFFDELPDTTTPATASSDGGSSGCAYNRVFDPVLPGLLLGALAFLGWRLRKKKSS